jgi:hypothetical protein
VALDQDLALEAVALHRVRARVKKIGVAAVDFAVAEHDDAASFADAPVLQADVYGIETVLHLRNRVPSNESFFDALNERQRNRLIHSRANKHYALSVVARD